MPHRLRFDRLDLDRYSDWGIHENPWHISTRVRILVVIDGMIDQSTTFDFGAGLFLEALRDTSFAWWVRFEVDVARRRWKDDQGNVGSPIENHPSNVEARYDFFRFDWPGFDLSKYDQVWLFGWNPGNPPAPTDADNNKIEHQPLTDSELATLANWMDAGGGVFATGDHHNMGAPMCSRVPRVRSMRRWTFAQGVPPRAGPGRHDTNQPATLGQQNSTEYMPFALEGDDLPQPIEVVWQPLWQWLPWHPSYAPHPILCTPDGVIEHFPDHPHEGEVMPDDQVQLDQPLGIAGYSGTEYPGLPSGPRPHIIAHGRTTHLQTNREKQMVQEKRFGLVGVYDGQTAGIGRVVVDSTWHHWFSGNLLGFKASKPKMWRQIRHYYRNVALWLATPAQRAQMLLSATWGVVVGSGPMKFPPSAPIWELGGRFLDVIGRTASQCTIREWVRDLYDIEMTPKLGPLPDPWLTRPPADLLERYVLGGLAQGLADVAYEYETLEAQGARAIPDPQAIAKGGTSGAARAQRELVAALESNAATVRSLQSVVGKAAREVRFDAPDLGRQQVRIFVEAVQILVPTDPALTGSTVDVALRAVVDGHLVGSRVFTKLKIPKADHRGIVLRLDKKPLAEPIVWEGSTLEVTVAASADGSGAETPANQMRGRAVLTGRPESWLGDHRDVGQTNDPWRLWLRVEPVQPPNPVKKRRR